MLKSLADLIRAFPDLFKSLPKLVMFETIQASSRQLRIVIILLGEKLRARMAILGKHDNVNLQISVSQQRIE